MLKMCDFPPERERAGFWMEQNPFTRVQRRKTRARLRVGRSDIRVDGVTGRKRAGHPRVIRSER